MGPVPRGSETKIRSCGESVILVDQAAKQVPSAHVWGTHRWRDPVFGHGCRKAESTARRRSRATSCCHVAGCQGRVPQLGTQNGTQRVLPGLWTRGSLLIVMHVVGSRELRPRLGEYVGRRRGRRPRSRTAGHMLWFVARPEGFEPPTI